MEHKIYSGGKPEAITDVSRVGDQTAGTEMEDGDIIGEAVSQ